MTSTSFDYEELVKFCPGCGAELGGVPHKVGLLNEDGSFYGFDCHCHACGWTGDICPDKAKS